VFFFELTDLYEKKNIPKVIYCIHALSYLLAKKGKAPSIKNLMGKLMFYQDVSSNTAEGLDGSNLPDFGNISKDLDKEIQSGETDAESNFNSADHVGDARLALEAEERI